MMGVRSAPEPKALCSLLTESMDVSVTLSPVLRCYCGLLSALVVVMAASAADDYFYAALRVRR